MPWDQSAGIYGWRKRFSGESADDFRGREKDSPSAGNFIALTDSDMSNKEQTGLPPHG